MFVCNDVGNDEAANFYRYGVQCQNHGNARFGRRSIGNNRRYVYRAQDNIALRIALTERRFAEGVEDWGFGAFLILRFDSDVINTVSDRIVVGDEFGPT